MTNSSLFYFFFKSLADLGYKSRTSIKFILLCEKPGMHMYIYQIVCLLSACWNGLRGTAIPV